MEAMMCPKCNQPHIDNELFMWKANLWHMCHFCSHKFHGSYAAIGTPLPENPPLTTAVLEYLEATKSSR